MFPKLHAHYVTGICATPGDDEQTTVIALTTNDEATFDENGGNPGDILAWVPCDENPEQAEKLARLLAAAPELLDAARFAEKVLGQLPENMVGYGYVESCLRAVRNAIDAAEEQS